MGIVSFTFTSHELLDEVKAAFSAAVAFLLLSALPLDHSAHCLQARTLRAIIQDLAGLKLGRFRSLPFRKQAHQCSSLPNCRVTSPGM
jgi:hypothetical protein